MNALMESNEKINDVQEGITSPRELASTNGNDNAESGEIINNSSASSLPQDSTESQSDQEQREKNSFPQNVRSVSIQRLKPHPEIKNLYQQEENIFSNLKEEIENNGVINIPPLQVICDNDNDKYLVIDGLTRLKAAQVAAATALPIQVIVDSIGSSNAVLKAIQMQCMRRPNDDKTILASIKALTPIEAVLAAKRQGKKASGQGCSEGANGQIAKLIGKSISTVKNAKRVLKDESLTMAVLNNELTINRAYEKIKADTAKAVPAKNNAEKSVALKSAETSFPNNDSKSTSATQRKDIEENVESTSASDVTHESVPKQGHSILSEDTFISMEVEDIWKCLASLHVDKLKILKRHLDDFLNEDKIAV